MTPPATRFPVVLAPATGADVPAIQGLLESVREWLLARGHPQWQRGFPADWVRGEVAAGRFWVAHDAAGLVTTVRLTSEDATWAARASASALYVQTLAVRRDRAGEGIGAEVLEWAAAQAAARGRSRLRLDFVAPNPRLEAYYAGVGFVVVGDAASGGAPVRLMERTTGA